MFEVEWKGGMEFVASVPSGATLTMDAPIDHGGKGLGPSPLEAFLASAAACSGIDVVSILEKKRLTIESYRLTVEWERDTTGPWPHPIKAVTVTHILIGPELTEEAVQQAVQLSDEKYCTVMATLRAPVAVDSKWKIDASASSATT